MPEPKQHPTPLDEYLDKVIHSIGGLPSTLRHRKRLGALALLALFALVSWFLDKTMGEKLKQQAVEPPGTTVSPKPTAKEADSRQKVEPKVVEPHGTAELPSRSTREADATGRSASRSAATDRPSTDTPRRPPTTIRIDYELACGNVPFDVAMLERHVKSDLGEAASEAHRIVLRGGISQQTEGSPDVAVVSAHFSICSSGNTKTCATAVADCASCKFGSRPSFQENASFATRELASQIANSLQETASPILEGSLCGSR